MRGKPRDVGNGHEVKEEIEFRGGRELGGSADAIASWVESLDIGSFSFWARARIVIGMGPSFLAHRSVLFISLGRGVAVATVQL